MSTVNDSTNSKFTIYSEYRSKQNTSQTTTKVNSNCIKRVINFQCQHEFMPTNKCCSGNCSENNCCPGVQIITAGTECNHTCKPAVDGHQTGPEGLFGCSLAERKVNSVQCRCCDSTDRAS